ncbi:MAG: cyclic nucleotide-binding domain-containing protein [Anaerolineae bacterium]|nr:cyclic nucleotide-binding domain-containing protein [Anaerolineae bacterium]
MPPEILSTPEFERLLALHDEADLEYTSSPDTPLMRLLTTIDRGQLSQLITEQHCQPGEVICWEGDTGDAMYLIRSGRVMILKGDLASPTMLGYRGPGETLGEMALLEGQPRSATNIARDDVRLLRISREAFHAWLSSSPAVGMSIMATLSSRLRSADNVRTASQQGKQKLVQQVNQLKDEKEQLLEIQRLQQETSDLIVHDLRNPLGVIYGSINMLELVLPEDTYHENRELLDLALSACERMQRLVDSLLDVAKFTTGEMPMVLTDVELAPILAENAHRQSVVASNRGVVLEVVVPDDLPRVPVDAEKLDRVLTNLLDNALKYAPDNSQITIAADLDTDHVIVSITDQGPGIPADQRQRIFDRFAQVDDEKPRRRGFGLGLTFCKLTVEAHGGTIWVEPGPEGIGSCFSFTLPLH